MLNYANNHITIYTAEKVALHYKGYPDKNEKGIFQKQKQRAYMIILLLFLEAKDVFSLF